MKKYRVEIALSATKAVAVVVNVDNALPHRVDSAKLFSQAIEAVA